MLNWQPLVAWALKQNQITDPTARFVLVCLAHHADADGRNAFPSIATLVAYTRLGERTVRRSLRKLEKSGLIRRGNVAVAAAKLRGDRRPICYDLNIERGAIQPPRDGTGGHRVLNGGPNATPRGATVAPDLPSDLPYTKKDVLREHQEELERRFGIPPPHSVTQSKK